MMINSSQLDRVFKIFINTFLSSQLGVLVYSISEKGVVFYFQNIISINIYFQIYGIFFIIGLIGGILSGGFKKNTSDHLIRINGREYLGFIEVYDKAERLFLEEKKIFI
ncbi:hypothetical protein OA57_11690 [Chelonobacter oris]|uniref:Uncharacterized protein n=1 Tax=Chelonobacter oris TaxID=505317 RepID=A0A0A3ANS0_9PAST|nr:hypothetical protein [Chelonobacter oris]KGQ69432.1 hypothetical protein OA57_11690 [Chelonobacter oris]